VSLFRLRFRQPAQEAPTLAGKPVYLGLMMNPTVSCAWQNLLINLPLRAAM
jgi:hypothetical protein